MASDAEINVDSIISRLLEGQFVGSSFLTSHSFHTVNAVVSFLLFQYITLYPYIILTFDL